MKKTTVMLFLALSTFAIGGCDADAGIQGILDLISVILPS